MLISKPSLEIDAVNVSAGLTGAQHPRYILEGKRVFVAGHGGMVGSALVRRLASENCNVLYASRSELDLTRQIDVEQWFRTSRPDAVFVAAARVGGILANASSPADFLYENLCIATNVVGAAFRCRVDRLLFLGSSCIYPRHAHQPIGEDQLLTGPLEPTNEAYAIAKIAGIKLCEAYRTQYGADFVSAMPTNLYGPGDNFDLTTSHVLPALIRKAHEAKVSNAPHLAIWGTGTPRREFLHADDCADALVYIMKYYEGPGHINVGTGKDIAIRDLAALTAQIVGYSGPVICDTSKPDGTPQKLLDCGRLKSLGWSPSITLSQGILDTYNWYLKAITEGGSKERL